MPTHHVDTTGHRITLPGAPAAPGSPIWIEIRPDLKRFAVIAGDLLAALGKRRDVAGVGRNEHEDIALAGAWMHAYDTTAIVATEAQRLSPRLLTHLVKFAKAQQLPLWLLHRPPHTDTFLCHLDRRVAHPRHLDEVPRPIEAAGTKDEERPTLHLDLPAAPFHHFLDACQKHLPPAQFATLHERHTRTRNRAEAALRLRGSVTGAALAVAVTVLANLVEEALVCAPDDDLLITDIRAIQAAAWEHDLYLKGDMPALLASAERVTQTPAVTDEQLTAYRQPTRILSIALAARQVGVTTITQLRYRDTDPATGTIDVEGRTLRLGPHTTRALRAQHHLHELRARADPQDRLIAIPDRAVSTALNDARTDLDIHVHGRRAERHVHPNRWLKKLGLTIHDLT
jgi:hypothetical protein